MQMVGRNHLHRIHFGVGQQLAVVGVRLANLPLGGAPLQLRLVNIADGVQFRFGVVLVAEVVQVGDWRRRR